MKLSTAISTFSLAALSSLPTALAHGHLKHVSIDGTVFPGPEIGVPLPGGSTIRMINSMNPIKDVTSDDMSCGNGAANLTAQLSAPAKAGSNFQVSWESGEDTNWPHNVGPLMTYIADCGGDCSKFNSLDAEWVKIEQAGQDPSDPTGALWIQGASLFLGYPYNFTLPEQIPTGNYLLRHEIIALHNAQSQGGAEFYPACMQLTVTGGSDAVQSLPVADEVKQPGAYSATDPGILVNVYNPGLVYDFPGPPLAFASSGDGTTSSNGTASGGNSGSGSTGAPTPSTAPSTSSSTTSGSSSGSSGSTGSGSGSTPSASMPTSTTTSTAPADGADDGSDCGSEDGSDDGSNPGASSGSGGDAQAVAIVTAYVTVTVQAPAAARTPTTTSTVFSTVSVLAVPTGAASSNSGAGSGSSGGSQSSTGNYRPKRRSRIMARRH